jgi:penicillin-binding protein 1A
LTVKDASGHVLENNTPVGESVLDPMVAYIMVNTMKDVIDHGTGRIVRRLGFAYPAAGKTGTTNENVDAWFIGYTPDLTCGVWVGYDERHSLGKRQTGGETAAPVWAEFMKAATAGTAPKDFEPPKGAQNELVKNKICLDSGLLATAFCPRTRDELFKKETVPIKTCNLHENGVISPTNTDITTGNSNVSSGGDILEMESQPVVKAGVPTPTTPSPTEGASPVTIEKKPTTDEAYPDQGF